MFDEIKLMKREKIMEMGINPYPYSYERTSLINEIGISSENNKGVSIAGRIMAIRLHGKSAFMDVSDHTGKIQVYLRKNTSMWSVFELLDVGDLIGVSGQIFRTRTGEITVNPDDLTVLAKTVVPVPVGKTAEEKSYYQISDPEIKYRKRYLDWITNKQSCDLVMLRAKIITSIRNNMQERGFLEVDTPTIEMIYGGAEARPFETSINALGNQKAYLRISPELYLKRYIVGGFEKVFTICKNFRNEGIDRSHNPEFTMMEWYEAYTDYSYQMIRFEDLVSEVAKDVIGSTIINYQGTEIDLTPPWRRMTITEAIKEYVGIDIDSMSDAEIKGFCDEKEVSLTEPFNRALAVMAIFEELVEDKLIQPTFIMDHPMEISPLTKVKRGNPALVERFEPYIYGMEVGNAYSELTDPVEQHQRLIEQRKYADDSDVVHHPVDMDFIEAIASGMPPTGGVGLGIDRLIMLLTDAPSIRDIIPFPMLRPEKTDERLSKILKG